MRERKKQKFYDVRTQYNFYSYSQVKISPWSHYLSPEQPCRRQSCCRPGKEPWRQCAPDSYLHQGHSALNRPSQGGHFVGKSRNPLLEQRLKQNKKEIYEMKDNSLLTTAVVLCVLLVSLFKDWMTDWLTHSLTDWLTDSPLTLRHMIKNHSN